MGTTLTKNAKYAYATTQPSLMLSALLLCSSVNAELPSKVNQHHALSATRYLTQLVSSQGIGAREAGSEQAKQSAAFIAQKLKQFGYRVAQQDFSFELKKQTLTSSNIIAELGDKNLPTIILGAHYDSTAKHLGSMGATDNGSGIAAMLAIAKALSDKSVKGYNIRFIAFGAEEVGLKGSDHYVETLLKSKASGNIVAMINFDTIVGGDKIYVHSAHTTRYKRCKNNTYNSQVIVRDALLAASVNVLGELNKYVIHPDYPEYPAGVTGSWSDHAAFACAGIPIAYVESTNFSLEGENGYDGYSQSSASQLWDCYDKEQATSCDRKTEKKWGNIWHTQFDSLDKLAKIFPGRVEQQLTNNVNVLIELLSDPDKYLGNK